MGDEQDRERQRRIERDAEIARINKDVAEQERQQRAWEESKRREERL